jgi:glycosyltransferase involved in cell wall biosynthesis
MTNNSKIKKIIFVENGIGYGGAIICLRHLVRNIDRSRFLPMVVTGRTGPQYQEIADESLWKHIPDRHIDIVSLKAKASSIDWLNKLAPLSFFVNQLLARADDVFNFVPFFVQLLWTAWRFDADLIHANNEPVCNRAALLVAKILRIPSICHVRGDPVDSRIGRWTYALPDHFVSVSNWVAEAMQKNLDVPQQKISVVYDGIALENLDININGNVFRQQYNIPENAFAVGLVGLLIPWKGQEIFLTAAAKLIGKIPNLKMLIIGGTPNDYVNYETELKKRVIEERLTEIVIFTGHISNMETVYNGLDIVVSASTSPEPLGTVVIESMAMGRPLIGPSHGGAAEMISTGESGLLFSPGDANSLAEAILAFYESPEMRIKLGATARVIALQNFSVETHTNKIQALYESLWTDKRQIN